MPKRMTAATPSRRAQRSPVSPIRELATLADQARQRGIRVYPLNIGQPELPAPPPYREAMRKLGKEISEYAPSPGYRESQLAWRQYYRNHGVSIDAKNIVITTGGSEAILFALIAVTDPGDEVVVIEPCYPNYRTLATMAGVRIRPITVRPEDGYHLRSRTQLTSALTKRTKAIIINNPSNPTGTVMFRRELDLVMGVAQQRKLFVLADEVYRDFNFTGIKTYPSLLTHREAGDRVVVIDSVSKRFSLCGARVGCLVSRNRGVIESVIKFSQARLSAPTLEQRAVVPLLRSPQRIVRAMAGEYRRRRHALVAALRKVTGVTLSEPEGALYVMVGLPVASAKDFCAWTVEHFQHRRETVLLAPGQGFYLTPGKGMNEARIAYILPPRELRRAAELMGLALAAYRRRARN